MRLFYSSDTIFVKSMDVILIILIGILAYFVMSKIINKAVNTKFKTKIGRIKVDIKRQQTVASLFKNLTKYLIIIIVIIAILARLGVNVTSLLAGLGIVGLVVGLALQDTIKDMVAGLFTITDKEYEIGDIIEVDGFRGEVIQFGLKITRIKDYTGKIKVINNSKIDTLINYTQSNLDLFIDIDADYSVKTDIVIKVLNSLLPKMKNLDGVLKTPEVLGVQELADSSVKYRIQLETKYNDYYTVRREILKMIKDEFDNKNIKIPFPQIEVHNGK